MDNYKEGKKTLVIMTSNRLYEVDIMRIILITLLLVDHSFAPFSGSWKPVEGQIEIPAYRYIYLFASSLFLQVFVFVSGYVYGMKCRNVNVYDVKKEIYKKIKRLMVPSLLFSIIYFVLFESKEQSVFDILYGIVCGYGHLWFLPMLFWCFVIVIVCEYYKFSPYYVLPLALIASLLSFVPLPLRLTQTFGFFIYFYFGFCITRYSVNIRMLSKNKILILLLCAIYLLSFISSTQVSTSGYDETNIISHSSRIVIDNVIRLFYSFFGLLTLLLLSQRTSNILTDKSRKIIFKLSGYCFGIYLFQQFVLRIFYYALYNGGYIYSLPWLGFIISGVISTLLTIVFLKLPVGEKILG